MALHRDPKGFFPAEDTGFIAASTEAASDVSFDQMRVLQRRSPPLFGGQGDRVCKLDNRSRRPNPTLNIGRLYIALKPRSERNESSTEVIQRLRRDGQCRPAVAVYFPERPEHQHHRPHHEKRIPVHAAVERYGDSCTTSRPSCATKIAEIEGLRDVTTDLYIRNPQMTIEIDREKAASTASPIDQIRQELLTLSGRARWRPSTPPPTTYQVILESLPQFQADPLAAAETYS
jgi:HAE1 family hydrophobic/amphiphilic exporter-1